MARFVEIDLSDIPPPDIIEALSFEALRAAILADGVARMNANGVPYNVGVLESDPFVALVEAYAARELDLRARINDAVRAVMLPSSWGSNLDNIGADFDTGRQSGEIDDPYRERIHIAPDAFSNAGPAGGYEYWARTVLTGLQDASAVMSSPGQVQLTLLYPGPAFLPTAVQIQQLAVFLRQEQAKPLTDVVAIGAPKLVNVVIAATLTLYPGPSQATIMAAAAAALAKITAATAALGRNLKTQKLGRSLSCSAIIAALQQPGVESVALSSPPADVVIDSMSLYNVTSVNLAVAPLRQT